MTFAPPNAFLSTFPWKVTFISPEDKQKFVARGCANIAFRKRQIHMSTPIFDQLQLAPMGAGDLIDRAIRLYRQHFLVLIRIAAPPVIVAAGGWILFSISVRRIFNSPDSDEIALYFLLALLSIGILIGGYLFTLIVMGAAARNLVAHLLRKDPVSARTTYRAVRSRFGGLLGAACLVLIWMSMSASAAFITWYLAILVAIFGAVALSYVIPGWMSFIAGALGVLVITLLALFFFFFIVGRVAYVSQVMLVEGKGVFEAFGRSFSLARGNVRRLMAMTLFTTFATNSALMILMIPLGWYGYLNGVDPINSAQWPAWYSIGYSVLGTLSSIMLTPVWVLGLSLLYIDERVRHEGYDVELLAARQLGELPDVNVASPFGPALSSDQNLPPAPAAPRSIFNLT